ncbi:hypothetical protein CSPAE12_11270 [Colletotrichum incanum]|nr:hypothetical protein CSPAE12_11270 [Colletotrichum incanum]
MAERERECVCGCLGAERGHGLRRWTDKMLGICGWRFSLLVWRWLAIFFCGALFLR